MILKPKSTALNPRALVYRRFIGLEKSANLQTIYKTNDTTYGDLYWTFDNLTLEFTKLDSLILPSTSKIVNATIATFFQYQAYYFVYGGLGSWKQYSTLPQGFQALSATFNNIGKYQMNRYYYAGTFDFMIKGEIEGTTSQYIKGNIMPLNSFNIKYFNDDIDLKVDDLVVVDKHLYSIENPSAVQKRLPKAFTIHYATLNSIL